MHRSNRKTCRGWAVAACVVVVVWSALAGQGQAQQSSLWVGLVTEKGEHWVSVRDRQGKVMRFELRRAEGAESADPSLVKTLADTPVGSKVIVKWQGGPSPVVEALTVLVRGSGQPAGSPDSQNPNQTPARETPADGQAEKPSPGTVTPAWKKMAGTIIYNYNPGKSSGSLTGSLLDKDREDYFEMWPDGMDRPIRVYIPRIRLENRKQVYDPRLTKKISLLKRHSHVRIDYHYDRRLLLQDIRLVEYPSGGGYLVGKIVAKGGYRDWVAVMSSKDQSVYMYYPALVAGSRGRKEMDRALRDRLQALELGTTVKIRWTVDEVRRILEVEVLAKPDPNEAVERLGAEELNKRRAARIEIIKREIADYEERIKRLQAELEKLEGPQGKDGL